MPLATLLGLAERPGEIHGFGLLDPALARELAAAAAASPRTEVCVTVTSPEGYAIGHGCARPARTPAPPAQPAHRPRPPRAARPAEPDHPRRRPPRPPRPGESRRPRKPLTPAAAPAPGPSPPAVNAPGPRAGSAPGRSTLPGGRELTARLDPVPTLSCDHRYESHGYQPSDRLRHLVQIRDGTCTFPPCNRHARESDFEHAIPYDQGGRTCACNAGRAQPRLPPRQANARVERHPAPAGLAPMADPGRPRLRARTQTLPRLTLPAV